MATKLIRKKKKYLVNVKKVKGHEKYFYFMSIIPQLMRDKNQREGEKQRGISNAKDGEWNRSHARRRRGLMYHTTAVQFIVTPHPANQHQQSPSIFPSKVCSVTLTSKTHLFMSQFC